MGEPQIDQTELALARDEGEALARAYAEPMTNARDVGFAKDIRKMAQLSGNIVLRDAREVLDPHALEEMKARMNEWVKVVLNYAIEIGRAKAMHPKARRLILATMLRERDRKRRELFGDD